MRFPGREGGTTLAVEIPSLPYAFTYSQVFVEDALLDDNAALTLGQDRLPAKAHARPTHESQCNTRIHRHAATLRCSNSTSYRNPSMLLGWPQPFKVDAHDLHCFAVKRNHRRLSGTRYEER